MCKSHVVKEEDIVVINLWKRHRLPYEVSTLWYNTECWYSERKLIAGNGSIDHQNMAGRDTP